MTAQPTRFRNQIIIYLALAALLGLAFWLRQQFIQTVHLYPDEFVTLLAIDMIGQKGLPVMPSGLFYEHGLLFSYAGWLATLFGPAQTAARYASLLFGLLTLALTFFVGRRWFSPAVGLLAVTGLAVAPAAIEWSSRARMYALLQLLILLTLWLTYEGFSQNKAGWRWAALTAYLGATLAHFGAVALAPPLVLAGLVVSRPKPGWRTLRKLWPQAIALLVILAVAFLVKRAGQPKGIEPLAAGDALTGIGQVFAIYSDFSFNIIWGWVSISPFYLTMPALIFSLLALIAIIQPIYQQTNQLTNKPTLFLSLILLTTTLEMVLMVSPHRRDDKYLFMLLPVLFLLGAQGMWQLWLSLSRFWQPQSANQPTHQPASQQTNQQTNRPTNQPTIIITLLAAGLILTASRPAVQSRLASTGDDYASAFAFVQARWQPGDKILTGTPAAAALYLGHNDFYSVQRRGGYDYRILTLDDRPVDRWLGSPAIRTEAALHETLSNHNVWLVLERWGLQREYYDLPFQQQLLAQTDHLPEAEAQGIFVLRSKANPQPIALTPAQPVEAILGEQIRLTGYTIEPATPAPGQPLRLTLYWQAIVPLPHDYTVFVHVRRPDGSNAAQADHRPLGAVYPTSLWPVGETIRETSDLYLPADLPPGQYELWTGLYRLDTLERLPVQNDASGENAVKLGMLKIGD